MRYCPNCHRINAGRPVICNYCGRTWHVRLCPRGHENPPNVTFCGTCGSTDMSETAGAKPWWMGLFRLVIWIIFILFIIALFRDIEYILPQLIAGSIPILILLSIYVFIGSLNIPPIRFINRQLTGLASKLITFPFKILKWILTGKRDSQGS